jgi:hypothetical protein
MLVLHHLPTPKPPQQHRRPQHQSPPTTNKASLDKTALFSQSRTVNQLDLLPILVWCRNQILYKGVDWVLITLL